MSLRPASQEQLDLIAAKLDLQAAEIAALRERVAVLEAQASGAAQGSEFELVSAAPGWLWHLLALSSPLLCGGDGN